MKTRITQKQPKILVNRIFIFNFFNEGKTNKQRRGIPIPPLIGTMDNKSTCIIKPLWIWYRSNNKSTTAETEMGL